jgi:hypothetical protein
MKHTFHLLWCEDCGRAEQAPRRPDTGSFSFEGPIVHDGCGKAALLIEASLACGLNQSHQQWTYAAYAHDLPTGRR